MALSSNDYVRDVAKLLAIHGFRNSIIEEYHAEGKLNDKEMMALNKDVHNRIYTLLLKLHRGEFERMSPLMSEFYFGMGLDWDRAKQIDI